MAAMAGIPSASEEAHRADTDTAHPSDDRGGTAKKRRGQRQRQLGRHVKWLTDLLQATSAHHTSASSGAALDDDRQRLRQEVATFRATIQSLQSQLAALETKISDRY